MAEFLGRGIRLDLLLAASGRVAGVQVPVIVLIPLFLDSRYKTGHDPVAVFGGYHIGRTARKADEAGHIPDLLLHDLTDFRKIRKIRFI